ncbi:MAG: hypothetical protein ACKVOW_05625 [Chitinophagaceae bacterium]
MSNPLFRHISIYLTVNENSIDQYFNQNDPAPSYRRQLSLDFEGYINNYVITAKRYTTIQYKFICHDEEDKQYTEPLLHAIRRHFSIRKTLKEAEFKRFKKRSFVLLFVALSIGIVCHWILPNILPEGTGHGLMSAVKNSLDVLSWVTLWRPIDKLVFQWNPFLKDISLFDKLTNAEMIVIDNSKKMAVENAA